MDIISYLLELIETRKNVGIIALGTLYKKKMPGRYDAETHAFLPPKHEIAFTTEILEEVELANFICEKRNISTESAHQYITEFVAEINSQLTDHQYADLSPLGTFKLINDQIEFESSKKFQIGFDFYGLPSISTAVEENQQPEANTEEPLLPLGEQLETAQPIIEEQAQSIDEREADDQPIYDEIGEVNALGIPEKKVEKVDVPQETVSDPPITEPIWRPTVNDRYEYSDDDDEDSGRGKRIFLKTLLILFIIAIGAAVVYFFYPDLLNNLQQNHQDQKIENASAVMTDTNATQQADTTFADTVKKAIIHDKPVRDTLKTDTVNKVISYEVIGSAMKSQRKVDEIIRIFNKRGIKAKAIAALPGRLIKISLGTFTDYNQAKKFQDSLKIKLKNPEIYIQTIKPKN